MKKPIVSLTLDSYLVQDLDYIARCEHRSRSAQVEILLRKGIQEWQFHTGSHLPAYEEDAE